MTLTARSSNPDPKPKPKLKKAKAECPIDCQAPRTVCVRGYLRDVPISANEYRRLIKKHI
jgi:hypothetical protein